MATRKSTNRGRTSASGRNGRLPGAKTAKSTVPAPERGLEKIHGVLQDFNFSPRGAIEGFLLHTDSGSVQVNVTTDVGFAVVRGIGQNVDVTAEPEQATAGRESAPGLPARLPAWRRRQGDVIYAEPGDEQSVTIQGTVKRINFAKHGEADGVILESGDFVHLKTTGMQNCRLAAGDVVTVEGTASRMPLGQHLVKPRAINGQAVSKKPAKAGRRSRE